MCHFFIMNFNSSISVKLVLGTSFHFDFHFLFQDRRQILLRTCGRMNLVVLYQKIKHILG